jgi:haloalkane dehalogenase
LWEQRDQLRRLPVTLVWGERDPAFGPEYLQRWRQALPDARVHALADAGHFPQEEAPDALLAALRSALVEAAAQRALSADRG